MGRARIACHRDLAPELITALSAVMVAAAPNVAVGHALGSCVFNLTMLVVLDEASRDEPIYRRVDQGHILTAVFGVILIGTDGSRYSKPGMPAIHLGRSLTAHRSHFVKPASEAHPMVSPQEHKFHFSSSVPGVADASGALRRPAYQHVRNNKPRKET